MRSRFLSILIVLAMLFGMVPNMGMVTAYGGTEQIIDVRVEGPEGALYESSVSVTDETNGLELLESAIGAENVLGYTSDYGYFLTGIVDAEGTTVSGVVGETWSTSWGVYEQRGGELESSATGLDGIGLEGLEELLVHYKAYDSTTYADLTFIPRVSAAQSGLDLTLTVNKEVVGWDEYWNPVVSESPMAGAVVRIGETEYTTDENGVVTPDLAFGTYEASVYKEGENYPELVRSEFGFAYTNPWDGESIDVRVEGPEGALYESSVSVTDETNGLELLESAIGAENVLGYTSDYGYFLTGIVDAEGTTVSGVVGETWSTSWGVYEQRGGELESSATGLDGISLEGLEELLVHYKAYDSTTYADLTYIPRVSAIQSGLDLRITVDKEISVWGQDPTQEPMAGAIVKIGETEYTTDENGVVTPDLAFGTYEASVYKEGENYPELVRSVLTLTLDDGSESGGEDGNDSESSPYEGMTNQEVIQQIVSELRAAYGTDDAFSFREALGYFNSGTMEDQAVIAEKIVLREVINQATDLAANILSVHAAGLEPDDYEGVNHLQRLIDIQNESGVFEVGGEGVFATQLAWSMTALDLAGGVYDEASATSALISFQNEDGGYGSIDFTAMAIPALVSHPDEPGAAEALEGALSYLRSNKETILSGANQYTLSALVNGLCAAGENPLADEWISGDDTLLNRMMVFYEEGTFGNASADEQAFLALSDLFAMESAFTGRVIDAANFDTLFMPSDDTSGEDDPATGISERATVTVKGYGETILSKTSVTIGSGDSVLDVTKHILDARGISYTATGGYVSEIDGLEEFDHGAQSGWMVKINGEVPSVSTDSLDAEDGDNIYWFYTADWTEEEGSIVEEVEDPEAYAETLLEDGDATARDLADAFDVLMEEAGEEAGDTLLLLAEAAIEKAGEISLEMDGSDPADMDASDLEDLAEAAVSRTDSFMEAFEDEGMSLDKKLESRVVVTVEADEDVAAVAFEADALKNAFETGLDEVAVATPWAEIALGADSLSEEDMDKEVVVEVKPVDASDLPEGAEVPDGATVLDLNLFVDGERRSAFNGTLTVSIPVDHDGDKGEALTVYWLKDDGSLVPVGGSYNEETGMIVFETAHFSRYFAAESDKSFEDMAAAAWAEADVNAMAGKGFINGRSPAGFDPSSDITRAEFAAIAVRMLNLSAPEGFVAGFADVAETDWYVEVVSAAKAAGLMNGKGAGAFDPNGKITRQEQAIVLANVLDRYGYAEGSIDLEAVFTDAGDIASWAVDGAATAVHHGLLKGMDGRFAPAEKATRAQSAVMLHRLYKLIMQ